MIKHTLMTWSAAVALVWGFSFTTSAQIDLGLVAHYSFDDCTARDVSPDRIGGNGNVSGNPACSCGVEGDAMEFDGIDDYVTFSGNVNSVFERNDFTISFYFKAFDAIASQNILSKRVDCSGNGSFFNVNYLLSLNFINTEINESPTRKIAISSDLDQTCWHHYAIVRAGQRVRLYLNGQLVDEKISSARLDLENPALFSIANSPCIGANTQRFSGKIDELRVYNRALSQSDINELYVGPDRIENRNPIIYLGQSVQADIPVTCANNFSWTPTGSIDDPEIPNPLLSPDTTTTYAVSILDDYGCTAIDSMTVTVIDPDQLDCGGIYLPGAFTPNGDGRNDTYGISNPLALGDDMISFEVFDRWGSRVFYATDPASQWDGTFQGRLLNGGSFVYRLTYLCDGEEQQLTDSFVLLR